jgi:hypothetical protein
MGDAFRSRTDNFEGGRYGTSEMAYEIIRLFEIRDVRSKKILVMAGHRGGIVAFGKDLEDAFNVLMRARELPQPCGAGGQNARAPRQRAE